MAGMISNQDDIDPLSVFSAMPPGSFCLMKSFHSFVLARGAKHKPYLAGTVAPNWTCALGMGSGRVKVAMWEAYCGTCTRR